MVVFIVRVHSHRGNGIDVGLNYIQRLINLVDTSVQSTHRWRSVFLGLDAGPKRLQTFRELHNRYASR